MSGFEESAKKIQKSFKILDKCEPKINDEQNKALKEISKINLKGFKVINFQGVTGSGKTRVYMKILKKKLEKRFAVFNSCSRNNFNKGLVNRDRE